MSAVWEWISAEVRARLPSAPSQSASALVIYERGHVTAGEFLRFGVWMTLVGWVAILGVALPWWQFVGEPLRLR